MPRPDHKSNLTGAAIALFRKQGFAATGLNQIILASGAPKGSLYHYFPGGKEELGATAVRVAGSEVADTLREIAAQAVSFADFLSRYLHMVAGRLTESGFQEGCPIATVLLENAPESAAITTAGQAVMGEWVEIIAEVLRRDGAEAQDAQRQAAGVLAAVEGGLLMARVQGSVDGLLDLRLVVRRSPAGRAEHNRNEQERT